MADSRGGVMPKAKGGTRCRRHVGGPRILAPELIARIQEMHESGLSLRKIGAQLESEGIPTAKGGARWYASTIKAVLESRTAQGIYTGP